MAQAASTTKPNTGAELDDLVGILFFARQYKAAKELEDNSPLLASAYAELGRRDEALAVAGLAEASTKVPTLLAQTASAYALAGIRSELTRCWKRSWSWPTSTMFAE
jgi:hypothetical protein